MKTGAGNRSRFFDAGIGLRGGMKCPG